MSFQCEKWMTSLTRVPTFICGSLCLWIDCGVSLDCPSLSTPTRRLARVALHWCRVSSAIPSSAPATFITRRRYRLARFPSTCASPPASSSPPSLSVLSSSSLWCVCGPSRRSPKRLPGRPARGPCRPSRARVTAALRVSRAGCCAKSLGALFFFHAFCGVVVFVLYYPAGPALCC